MTVSDDGVGFDAQRLVGSSQAGLGLLTMRERAAMAGGELSVISSPGNGTQIRVVVEPHEEEQTIPQQDGENRLGEDQKRLAPMRRLA
jgi:signal transduction histidine kinase